jgi:transcriptional regulator with PAS, ATPase and Fis domain
MAQSTRGRLRPHFKTWNRALARELENLERAADLPSTILILGESGTGKDRLARAVHDASHRAGRPFVRVDAANLSDELFESELFGHERGAFTGAVAAKRGLLEVAEDGTV